MINYKFRSLPLCCYMLLLLFPAGLTHQLSAQTLEADFTLSKSNICVGSSVTITDNSSGTNRYTRYYWDFGKNAVPSSASGEGPHIVTYTKDGSSEITLTLSSFLFVSDKTSKKIKVSKYPPEPEAKITPSACDNPSGIIEITSPDDKETEYSLDGISWQSSEFFENLTANETYTVSVRNLKENAECISTATFTVPPDMPDPPKIKQIIQPSCENPSGSIEIDDLPPGEWTLTRYPGEIEIQGDHKEITITDLPAGEYSFRVMNASGCLSAMSESAVIHEQPASPEPPVQTVFCSSDSELAIIRIDSPTGTGYEYSLDGGRFQKSTVFEDVPDGTHQITVRNSDGCTSAGNDFEVRCSCQDPPALRMEENEGRTCSSSPKEVSNVTFGGSAEMVIISENGSGRINIDTAFSSPFSFTYTPAKEDEGKTVTITLLTDNPVGSPCEPARIDYRLKVDPVPDPPQQSAVIQPDCQSSTGAITLNGLPSPGQWTLVREPGSITTEGSGAETSLWDIDPGKYTFTVRNSYGCTSGSSAEISVSDPPPIPAVPHIDTVIHPGCGITTGNITFSNLPEGNWSLSTISGDIIMEGTGNTATAEGLNPGTYNFILSNYAGCTSGETGSITINEPPRIPDPPQMGEVFQPDCEQPSGSIHVKGLPAGEYWNLILYPDAVTISGQGEDTLITGLSPGTYNFTITGANGCESGRSEEVEILENPLTPDLVINNPDPICISETLDLTDPGITENSDPGLAFSYWMDKEANTAFSSPASAGEGTYYIKAENEEGCFVIKPVTIEVVENPTAEAGPDQELMNEFETFLEANEPGPEESAIWSVLAGNASFTSPSDPFAAVSNLSPGENILVWTVSNEACPPSSDSVVLTVGGFEAPTLITPNADGINDYLKFPGLPSDGKTKLVIFNRIGTEVYTNDDYNNNWNGIDYHGNPLPADTYFYILVSQDGRVTKSFVVLRR